MRLNLVAAAGLLPLALLASCAGRPIAPTPPAGLLYSCRTAAGDQSEALIVFNGQGYQPGNVVRTAAGELPRSTATLTFAGRDYDLMADWTDLGMRYRSVEPVEGARALVWTADGEDARLATVPISEAGGEAAELASCVRKRTLDAAQAHAEGSSPHHR